MKYGNMSDICDKLNVITNYTQFNTTNILLSQNTHILQFLTPGDGLVTGAKYFHSFELVNIV